MTRIKALWDRAQRLFDAHSLLAERERELATARRQATKQARRVGIVRGQLQAARERNGVLELGAKQCWKCGRSPLENKVCKSCNDDAFGRSGLALREQISDAHDALDEAGYSRTAPHLHDDVEVVLTLESRVRNMAFDLDEAKRELDKLSRARRAVQKEANALRARCNVMASDPDGPWVWVDHPDANRLDGMCNDMVVQITAGHLRDLLGERACLDCGMSFSVASARLSKFAANHKRLLDAAIRWRARVPTYSCRNVELVDLVDELAPCPCGPDEQGEDCPQHGRGAP